MIALSSRPFCPCDGRQVSLSYLAAGLRYTTVRTNLGVTGQGVRVGIISDSLTDVATSVNSGDLQPI